MILNDSKILEAYASKEIYISNFNANNLNNNSYDLTLANKIAWYPILEHYTLIPMLDADASYDKYGMAAVCEPESAEYTHCIGYLDPAKENLTIEKTIPEEGVILLPNILYLAMVNEELWSDSYIFELTGKSTLARLGVIVHHTAGYSNLGHKFKYVLEIQVAHPIRIYPNMKIAQVFFHTTNKSNDRYSGNYMNSQLSEHISTPKPIKGFEDVVEKTPTAYSIAVNNDDISNFHHLKDAGDLKVDMGCVTSEKLKTISDKVIPHSETDDDENCIVTSYEFKE